MSGQLVTAHSSWQQVKLKHIVRRHTAKGTSGRYVGLEHVESWTGKLIGAEATTEVDSVQFQAGDVLFGKLRPYLAKVLSPDFGGNCTSEMLVLRPASGVVAKFLMFRLLTRDFIDRVDATTFGSKMPRAEWEQIGSLLVEIPEMPQQLRVARFLDRTTAQIDDLIAKKERLIELLEEKRAAVISRAVTQGLDPRVRMKESGVEWLGRIPAHWSVKRVKHSLDSIEQGWSPQCDSNPSEDGEWGVLKVGCVNGWDFDPNENKALPKDLDPVPSLEVRKGDVLVSRANTRELLGSAVCIGEVRPRLLLCDKLYRLRPKGTLRPELLAIVLRTKQSRAQIEPNAIGTSASMQNIGQDTIRDVWIAIPPTSEQDAILMWVRERAQEFSDVGASLRTTIDRLREYRSALITAAVTGQLDLREHEKKMEALA